MKHLKTLLTLLPLLLSGVVPFPAQAADNILVPKNQGKMFLKDANSLLFPGTITYTTDGAGHLKLINSSNPVDDSITTDGFGHAYLNGADGNLYPVVVTYTTDGSGNVIPIASGGGGGGVSSVGLALPSIFGVTGSPITSSGTLTASLANQLPNTVFAGPAASPSATPSFRALVAADIPSLTHTKISDFATAVPGAIPLFHDVYVTRTGTDASGCGTIAAPCHTIGYILANIVPLTGGSSTSVWTIHASDRNDAETGDILIPPYVFISCLGSDVAGYIRSTGHSIKLGSGWTSNGRGGIQGCYISSTPVLLDFASVGGSAGSNFMLDDVFITSTYTHTGRGVNGGDFEYMQNTFFFGAVSDTSGEFQAINSTFAGSVTLATTGTIPMDAVFIGGNVAGAFSETQSGSATASIQASGTAFDGGFSLTGTITKTYDNLSISGLQVMKVQAAAASPTCNSSVVGSVTFTSAFIQCVCNGTGWVKTSDGSTACTF